MRRGTTYRIRFNMSQNLSGSEAIHIAFKNRKTVIVKKYPEDIVLEATESGGCSLAVILDQSETLSFKAGTGVTTQIRCRMEGIAYATPIYSITGPEGVLDVIEEGVI